MKHTAIIKRNSVSFLKNVAIVGLLALSIASCKKKEDDPAPAKKTTQDYVFTSGTCGIKANGQDFSLQFKEGDLTGGVLYFEFVDGGTTDFVMEIKGVDEVGDYDVEYTYWNDDRAEYEKTENVVDGVSVDLINDDTDEMTGTVKYTSSDLTLNGVITLKK